MSAGHDNTLDVAGLVRRLRDPGRELALLDVREEGQFGEGHMLWAVNVPYSRLEAAVVTMVPRRAAPVVLVDEGDGVAARAQRRLRGLGYRDVQRLAGGIGAWRDAGHPLFKGVYVPGKVLGEWVEARWHTPSIDAHALQRLRAEGRKVLVLDPRTEAEHAARHVPQAWSCPNGELLYRHAALAPEPDMLVVVACGGRTRGIVGAQTLIDAGVEHPVVALEDGNHGWQLAGLELEHGLRQRAPRPEGEARLALAAQGERHARRHGVPRIDLAQWRQWREDADRTSYLLDVRSPEEYAQGHLDGAVSAPGGQLVQASDRWLGTLRARVVLVDDDGVRAVQTALWLRRLGWDAYALTVGASGEPGVPRGADEAPALSADAAARVETQLGDVPAQASELPPREAHERLRAGALAVHVDRSDAYLAGHPPGALWANRARLDAAVEQARAGRPLLLFSADGRLAQLAAIDLREAVPEADLAVAQGGLAAWAEAGLPLQASSDALPREARIDFLFWAHDRRRGNAEAMRAYLQWEKQLLAQAEREPGGFPLAGGPISEESLNE